HQSGFPEWAREDTEAAHRLVPGDGNDVLIGSGHLYGGSGNNYLYSLGGESYLYGGGSAAELQGVPPGSLFYFMGGSNYFFESGRQVSVLPNGSLFYGNEYATGVDTVYGGNGGHNYLQFIGSNLSLLPTGSTDDIGVITDPTTPDAFDSHPGI